MLFFLEIIQLLVEETKRYYQHYLDTLDKGRFPVTGITIQEMYLSSSIFVQIGHDQRDTLKSYWSTLEQFFMPFYRNPMKWDSFFHILTFLHFGNNKNEPNKTATHATVKGLTIRI